MMRTSHQPLAHLVDRQAERWLTAERNTPAERASIESDIAGAFNIGNNDRMTFHGQRFLLTIINNTSAESEQSYRIEVHEIARND